MPQQRASRSWRQTVTSMMGYGGPTTNNQGTYGDENDDDNIMVSPPLVSALKSKDYRVRLSEIFGGLVVARRTYLNHVDENWQQFLDRLQEAFVFFESKAPLREYRDSFTIENYRMLFQRESSAYRDDVCRGVKRIRDGMWVNGEEVKFHQVLVDEGFDLASRGEKLMDLVFMIDDLELHRHLPTNPDLFHPSNRPAKTIERFRQALKVFDERYVIFEKNYIEALIAVEKQSRSLVQQVAELIAELGASGEKVNQTLLNQMAELNKKSRDCFNCKYDVAVMRAVLNKSYESKIHQRLWYLPQDLIDRFDEICKYLQDLLPKILRVHPKLEHNPGLVQRLEKFHDTYQRVIQWVTPGENAMSNFCEFLEEVLPDTDLGASVEGCLLIPRAFCLFVWKNREELTSNPSGPLHQLVHEFSPELLVEITTVLTVADKQNAPMETLVQEIIQNGISSPDPSSLSKAWEHVSMQLQRSNANSWNSFVSVILHEEEDPEEKMARPRLPSV